MPITEPALLTRCAWESHAINCTALIRRHKYVKKHVSSYSLQSQNFSLLSVPVVRTELGKKTFQFAAPSACNNLQNKLKLRELVSLDVFKGILNDLETETSGCRCFVWFSYLLSLLLFYFCLCALMDVTCKTHVRFCVAGNLGQDALVKYFNLNVLFLVK